MSFVSTWLLRTCGNSIYRSKESSTPRDIKRQKSCRVNHLGRAFSQMLFSFRPTAWIIGWVGGSDVSEFYQNILSDTRGEALDSEKRKHIKISSRYQIYSRTIDVVFTDIPRLVVHFFRSDNLCVHRTTMLERRGWWLGSINQLSADTYSTIIMTTSPPASDILRWTANYERSVPFMLHAFHSIMVIQYLNKKIEMHFLIGDSLTGMEMVSRNWNLDFDKFFVWEWGSLKILKFHFKSRKRQRSSIFHPIEFSNLANVAIMDKSPPYQLPVLIILCRTKVVKGSRHNKFPT